MKSNITQYEDGMSVTQSIENNDVTPFNDYVFLPLGDGRVLGDHVANLPLTDAQKKIIRRVQSRDLRVAKYVHEHAKNGKLLVEILGIKALQGYNIDLLSGRLYTPNGEPFDDYRINNARYVYPCVGSRPLHELVYFQYLMRFDQKLYDKVMANRGNYNIHHIDASKKTTLAGNSIFNLKLLPVKLHRTYESILKSLEKADKKGEWTTYQQWTPFSQGDKIA